MSRYVPRSVVAKTLYDRRWFIIGWCLGLGFLAWFVGVFYNTFGQSQALNAQFQSLPPALRSVAGVTNDFATVAGYYGSQIYNKTMPMVAPVLGIMLGVGLANEEEQGTLQTLLAMPISRTRLLLARYAAAIIAFAILAIGLTTGLAISLWQQHLSIDAWHVFQASVNVLALCLFFFSLTYATAAIWGKRSVAIAVGSLVAISGYLLNTMAVAIESLKPYDKLSPYFYYGSDNVLSAGLNYARFGALLAACLLLTIIAGLVFARRDITSS